MKDYGISSIHNIYGKKIDLNVVKGVDGVDVFDIGDGLFELTELKVVKVSEWDSDPKHAGCTAIGIKNGKDLSTFIMCAYSDHHNCGYETLQYVMSRGIKEPVVCPAKTLEELGLA